jgi:molybdopterin/thiamine biosynthesis adenylyltransferase
MLSEDERERHARQLALEGIGEEGQERLAAASVLVVGAGALGSPVLLYLAAAGVGRIGIVDDGEVTLGDLGRQVVHFTPDAGVPRAHSAQAKLGFLNPGVALDPYPARVEEANAGALVLGHDVVVDAANDEDATLLLNDACCAAGVPLVTGGVDGWDAWVQVVRPGVSACLRCDESAPVAGVSALGAVAGVAGSAMALEALKLVAGTGEPLAGRLELAGATGQVAVVPVPRRSDCPACGAL